jgi:hypothetical protein
MNAISNDGHCIRSDVLLAGCSKTSEVFTEMGYPRIEANEEKCPRTPVIVSIPPIPKVSEVTGTP